MFSLGDKYDVNLLLRIYLKQMALVVSAADTYVGAEIPPSLYPTWPFIAQSTEVGLLVNLSYKIWDVLPWSPVRHMIMLQ